MQVNFDSPLTGIQRGQQMLRSAASDIARNGLTEKPIDHPELSASLVQVMRAELLTQASTKALSAEVKLLGGLLDITV